jgi:secreted trypsin-like serine protease
MTSVVIEYFKQNIDNIILVAILFITLLVVFAMLNVDFNPLIRKSLKKVVTIEPLQNNNNDKPKSFHNRLTSSFCNKTNSPSQQEEKCKKLNEHSCNSTNCCIWLSNNTCVTGNKGGPVFHGKRMSTMDGINVVSEEKDSGIEYGQYCNSIDGKKCFTLDYYYFRNKCINARGKCPKNN